MANDPQQWPDEQLDAGGQWPELTSDAKTWGGFCHLAALLGLFPLTGFGHVVAPLVVWLLKRSDHPFIDEHGKESVNFQITVTIYSLLIAPLFCFLVGIPLFIALWIANIVFIIRAFLAAGDGRMYRYPLCLRLIK